MRTSSSDLAESGNASLAAVRLEGSWTSPVLPCRYKDITVSRLFYATVVQQWLKKSLVLNYRLKLWNAVSEFLGLDTNSDHS